MSIPTVFSVTMFSGDAACHVSTEVRRNCLKGKLSGSRLAAAGRGVPIVLGESVELTLFKNVRMMTGIAYGDNTEERGNVYLCTAEDAQKMAQRYHEGITRVLDRERRGVTV